MSNLQSENPQESSSKIKTPTKRTPSKRLSAVEKAQLESVEVIKNMGGSLDVEGGRRTRSSARGVTTPTAPATPPPAKKPRQSSTPRRGRPKKLTEVQEDGIELKSSVELSTVKKPSENVEESKNLEIPKKEDAAKPDTIDDSSAIDDKKSNIEEDAKSVTEPMEKSAVQEIEKSVVDAGKLDPISENHVAEKKEETIETPEVVVAIPEEKQSPKENVPEIKLDPVEPMEVDGSKNPEEKQNINTTITTINNCASIESAIEKDGIENIVKNDITKTEQAINASGDLVKKSIVDSNNVAVNAVATTIPQNDNKTNSIENEKPTENKILESDDKKENDTCEPKISSPPPADGITQPQTCN